MDKQDIPDLIAGALGVSRGTAYDMMCEALAERYAGHNPLGGPAKVFDAMAAAIRAGDSYGSVLRQYGFLEAKPAQQEPVDFTSLLHEADAIVRGKPVWKQFIDGTPLSNDIAVWMTVFAQDVARRITKGTT